MITDYLWIDDSSQLQDLVLKAKSLSHIAFDSEFERINTYYPKPSLFQLKLEQQYVLLDLTQMQSYEPIPELINRIVLHSGSEDLELIQNMTGTLPERVDDTQVAASLLGFGLHVSYQNLVKELMGVDIDKAHSRSDWMQRPLSSKQIQYALEDVVFLTEMHDKLQSQLQTKGLVPLYLRLIDMKLESITHSHHEQKTFLKMITAKKYNAGQQKRIMALLKWREVKAKERNKPRGWILKNHQVIDIALTKPRTDKKLINDIGLHPSFVKHNAEAIFHIYKEAETIDFESLPQKVKLTSAQGQNLNQMKSELASRCKKLQIPEALIANNATLKELAARGEGLKNLELWSLIS